MRRVLLLSAIVLAFGLSALAQGATGTQSGSQTTTTTTKTTKTKPAEKGAATGTAAAGEAKTSQLTGCLGKGTTSGYTLTNGRYRKGVDVKSDKDFSEHVGHQVRLTGTWEKPTAGAAGPGTFVATDLKHVAATCPATGAKAAKTETTETKSTTKTTTEKPAK